MLAILSNIHDAEAPYIESFVRYHSKIGVKEFIFASSERCQHQRVKKILRSLFVPLIIVPAEIPMRRARDWCHKHIQIESPFVAAIDIDEFLLPEHLDYCSISDCDHASFPWLCNVHTGPTNISPNKRKGILIARGKSIFKIGKAVQINYHRAIMEPGTVIHPMWKAQNLPIHHFYARSCYDLTLKDLYTRTTDPEYASYLFSDYAFAHCFFSAVHPAKLTSRLAACALVSSLQSAATKEGNTLLSIDNLEDACLLEEILKSHGIHKEHVNKLSANINDLASQVTKWQQTFIAGSLADIKYFTGRETSSKYGWFLDQYFSQDEGVNIRPLAVELFKQNYLRAQSSQANRERPAIATGKHISANDQSQKIFCQPPWTHTRSWNKCFGIGFNKTGTTSLDAAMKSLGLRSHQSQIESIATLQLIKGNYEPLLNVMKDYEFHQDLPASQGWHFAALDAIFPGSKFILTTRDTESWAESFISYYSLELLGVVHGRESRDKPYLSSGYTQTWLAHFILATDIRNGEDNPAYAPLNAKAAQNIIQKPMFKDRLMRIYETRNSAIRSYFAGRPIDFIEVDVSTGDCLGRLCNFLGAPVIEAPMPHLHGRSTNKPPHD